MIYQHKMESFSLQSHWNCLPIKESGKWVWRIVDGPSADSKGLDFDVNLPADAVISRMWVSVTLGAALSGAAYKRINGTNIPSSGEVDVDGITPETTTFHAVFSFAANGAIFEDDSTHTAYLRFSDPTLNIEYTSDSESAPDEPEQDTPGDITRDPDAGTQLPRLLNADMTEAARLEPSKLSLDLLLTPLSTAQMVLPYDGPVVRVRNFVELFDPNGSVGTFRVTEIETAAGRSRRCYLEHAFSTLSDSLAIGVQAMSGKLASVLAALLEAQTVKHWRLGDVELPDEYEVIYDYRYDNLMTAILDLIAMLPDEYALELDTLQYPWVMHVRRLTYDDRCECRLRRNLSSVTITIDATQQCTRVYPFGAGEGTDRIGLSTLTGAMFEDADNIAQWGVISKTFTNEEIYDSITLQEVARNFLDRHKEPAVSVEMDAMDLFAVTGERLDRFRLGRLCRLPLHDYGVIMHERVIGIAYPDVYGQPQKARVTLANKIREASDEIAELIRAASASKLIGGTVKTDEIKSSVGGITIASPYGQTFEITGYGNLLAVRLSYTCTIAGSAQQVGCRVTVDGNTVPDDADKGGTVDILRYLTTDDSGVPVVGKHTIGLSPKSTQGVEHWVQTTIVIKTIDKS